MTGFLEVRITIPEVLLGDGRADMRNAGSQLDGGGEKDERGGGLRVFVQFAILNSRTDDLHPASVTMYL